MHKGEREKIWSHADVRRMIFDMPEKRERERGREREREK